MKRRIFFVFTVLILISVVFLFFRKSEDIAFINGKIYTVETDSPWVEAILIEDGKISELGTNDLVLQRKKKSTRLIDLKGKMVLPGFHDSHVHVLEGGFALGLCNLNSLKSRNHKK